MEVKTLRQDPRVTRIVVEHHDRLTRFGFHYLPAWMAERGRTMEVINEVTPDREDLRKDFVSLVTRFVARLQGLRRSRRQTEQIIRSLETTDADTPVE
jgi:predicted site-specific integrase-resolvase